MTNHQTKQIHNDPLAPIEIITNAEREAELFLQQLIAPAIVVAAILGALLGFMVSHFTNWWLR